MPTDSRENCRMTGRLVTAIFLVCACPLTSHHLLRAADWLQWRGPLGTGQSDEKAAPLTWSQNENVKWKVTLDGKGNSSPIVIGPKIFIVHAPAEGNLRGIQ